jgi:pyruvate dehydrogenase E1 component beta subunit
VREGSDVTVVATQLARVRAGEAAEELADDGISVELIDPRTLVPLDMETIRASVERTSRLVVVQESPAAGSWGATVVAGLIAESFDALDAPPVLISGDETPVPYAGAMERAWLPSAERIGAAVRQLG